jgi:Sigma-70, region 4
MAPLDSLPADQRAVLQLVLQRGRTYDDIAKLLSIDRSAVRQRALSALDALGPDTDLPSDQRADITDYLLGQLSSGAAQQTRERLADSAPERAWARVIASELTDISRDPLPEIPAAGGRSEPPEPTPAQATEAAATEPEAIEGPGEVPAGAAAAGAAAATAPIQPRESAASRVTRALRGDKADSSGEDGGTTERAISRRGGAILLAVLAIVVIAVVVILATSGGSSNHPTTAATTPATTTPAATTGTTGTATTGTTGTGTTTAPTQVVGQINLNSPTAGSKTTGIAEVLKQGATDGIAIVAQNVPANTKSDAYAVWLYNAPTDAHLLGFVNPGVTSNGRLSTAGPLPSNASHFKQLIVTRETQASPKSPGTIILQGTLTGV